MTVSREEFKELVRQRVDLVTLAAHSGEVKGHGDTLKMRCPFHDENSPSMVLWPEQGRWHCFGACSEGGDVFAWVMKRDHVEFPAAVEILAREVGLEVPVFQPETDEQMATRGRREAAHELLDLAAGWYHHNLLSQKGAEEHRLYLTKRGFGDQGLWQRWQLGAAGNGNSLLGLLQKRGADLGLAAKVGLIRADEKTGNYRDFFYKRLIIPVLDGGRVVFLSSRTIVEGQEPKYLHLPNSEFARKTSYNARSAQRLVVVEGPTDVWAVGALADKGISAIALLGLSANDSALKRAAQRAERVYVALDDDSAGQERVNAVAQAVGAERAYVVRWPGGDDAASWFAQGANGEEFSKLLDSSCTWLEEVVIGIEQASDADKPKQVEKAVKIAVGLPPAFSDKFLSDVKATVKRFIKAKTIDEMVKGLRQDDKAPADGRERYHIENGELWYGWDENARLILSGGFARYSEMVHVDDGEQVDLALTLEIHLQDGRVLPTRLPSDESGEVGKLLGYIKSVAGPKVILEHNARNYLVTAVEKVSAKGISERTELARTGWAQFGDELTYLTPGGVIGALPDGYSVALPKEPKELSYFGIKDGTDEEFQAGLDGLLDGFLKAFEVGISYPALAFALTPPAARWAGSHKFAMHFSGETGSLKTAAAKTLMTLYGAEFLDAPPLMNWRSTINAIEKTGFWLPDALGLVDDYKPRIVKLWEFVELIQRYADGNARLRMDRSTKMRRREAMRMWMLSTGEDLPVGESSVLARMVALRFPRRPGGQAYNAALGKAQRLSVNFHVVMARWIEWLRARREELGLPAAITLYHQLFADQIQKSQPDAPNANRIARNMALLGAVWDKFIEFLIDANLQGFRISEFPESFADVGFSLSVGMAQQVAEEKPTRVFLGAVQEGFESGRFALVGRLTGAQPQGLIGYYDAKGVYILPAAYNEVSKWLRESGQQVGFSRPELYRLLREEGLLASNGNAPTTVIYVGEPGNNVTRRVMHIRPGVIDVPQPKGQGTL